MIFEAMNLHYIPAFLSLKEDLKKLGDIKIVSFNYSQYSSRYNAFKEGNILPAFDFHKAGGALMDLNVYNIHALIDLFGKPVYHKYMANIERNIDTSGYDVIKGWRANASYFYIAKEFVRDNIDIDILKELLSLGGLGIQYCVKSELAYSKLQEVKEGLLSVDYTEFREKYNQRDISARQKMRELVDSDANKVTKVFSTLL